MILVHICFKLWVVLALSKMISSICHSLRQFIIFFFHSMRIKVTLISNLVQLFVRVHGLSFIVTVQKKTWLAKKVILNRKEID